MKKPSCHDELTIRHRFDRLCQMSLKGEAINYYRHIFKMMGMELSVDYIINPIEMYLIFPLVILVTTTVSAFLTSLYTRKIKASDTANIE